MKPRARKGYQGMPEKRGSNEQRRRTSVKMRERAIALSNSGYTREEIMVIMKISPRTLTKYMGHEQRRIAAEKADLVIADCMRRLGITGTTEYREK